MTKPRILKKKAVKLVRSYRMTENLRSAPFTIDFLNDVLKNIELELKAL